MRDGLPSQTARRVAAYRLGFDRLTAPFGDPSADDRLAANVGDGVDIALDGTMARYLRHRTAFFDRVVVNGLERGCTQIAVIGAGYDGRALRYARPGVRWFEVDHPATQSDKRNRLAQLAISAPQVTLVPADLTVDDAAERLTVAGFVPDGPSLLLCEGLAVYLDAEVLAGLLGQLRSIATAGTRLALSAGVISADPVRRRQFATRVAEWGEPVALAGVKIEDLLSAARWRAAELSEPSRRAGLFVGVPVWEPGRPPTRSAVGAYLERTFHRSGLDLLADHLHDTYGIVVTDTRRLDVGVVHVRRADGPAWVARILPADRPVAATHADARVLRYLSDINYPAERLADRHPVSMHDGQAVLVTQYLEGKAPPATRPTFRRLGDLLGRLHTPPGSTMQPNWPGGGWHHLVPQGGPEAEIASVRELFAAHSHPSEAGRASLAVLQGDVDDLDDLADLPHAFTHPDFVAANAVVVDDGVDDGKVESLVLLDWTGAGRAPRLWTLGFLLWSAALAGPRCIDAVAAGYRGHVRLQHAELARLESAVGARPIIFNAWSYATGRRSLADAAAESGRLHERVCEIAARGRRAFEMP